MRTHRMIVVALLCLLVIAGRGRAVDEKLVGEIKTRLGTRAGLVVHVGAGSGELALSLARDTGYVVHGLEPDGAAVAASREACLEAELCGRVTIEQTELTPLPYVNQLANAVVIDDWKRVSEAGLDAEEVLRVLAPFGLGVIGQSARHGKDVKTGAILAWLKRGGVRDAEVVKKDGAWVLFTKPRPEGMDVWTHKWHDATRNHASQDRELDVPSTLHWINSTAYTWSMRQYRATKKNVYYFFYNGGGLSRWGHRKKPTQTIEAYDAYSGVLLWSREMPEASSGFPPITLDDRVILTTRRDGGKALVAISAETGEDLLVYGADVPADGVVLDGVLVWMFAGLAKGIDVKTGEVLWERKPAGETQWQRGKGAVMGFQEYCIVAANGMVFLCDRIRGDDKKTMATLIGLDIKTGDEKWSFQDPRLGDGYQKYFYHQGRLVLSTASGFLGAPLDPKEGPWHIPVTGFDRKGKRISSLRGAAAKSAFAIDGRLWIRGGSQFGMVPGEDADIYGLMPPKEWVAFDVATGKRVKAVGYDIPPPLFSTDFDALAEHLKNGPIAGPIREELVKHGQEVPGNATLASFSEGKYWRVTGSDKDENGKRRQIDLQLWRRDKELWFWRPQGWQQRCFPDLGCPSFIISSNNEFVDLESGEITQNRGLRGNCGEGPFFGNGLYYMVPHYCCFCYPMVRGGIAMGGKDPPEIAVRDDNRLEKGAALDSRDSTLRARKADEWPMYRATPRRVCGTTASVGTPLAEKPAWQRTFGERITQALAADGRVYTVVVNQGRVCALDAKTGETQWQFVAGGRIDTPPTLHAGLVLFGCHDGYVYALRAADGRPAWRFNAAPQTRRMLVRDRLESSWPVPGAVLVNDGVLYFAAGRITSCDGGMHMYALDAVSGEMKWHRNVKGSNHPKLRTGIDCWHEPQGELCNGILLARGDELLLTDEHMYWRFRADTGEQIIPEAGSSLALDLCTEEVPWMGMDRPTWMANFHGENMVPEIRFPYCSGTPVCFPAPDAVGLVCKRFRKNRVMQFFPCKPGQLQERWEHEKRKDLELEWAPWTTKVDVHAFCAAGDTVFYAGPEFDPTTDPATGELRALSLKDGRDLEFGIKLPASPVYDGLSVAYGKVFVSLQDGTLLCLSK